MTSKKHKKKMQNLQVEAAKSRRNKQVQPGIIPKVVRNKQSQKNDKTKTQGSRK